MHPSALPVRTDRHFAGGESFHDLMAERLRQAPWLVLSAAAHALLLLLLWVLLPPEQAPEMRNSVTFSQPEAIPVETTPPEKPPVPIPEETVEDPVVADPTEVFEPTPEPTDSEHVETAVPSAFSHDQWNTAPGLAGGAASPYGQRRGGRGGHPPAPPLVSEAVEASLRWLERHQDDDGKWDCDDFMKHDDPTSEICTGPGNAVHDVGVTGLALLAFLGEGNTLRSGPYRDTVRKAVAWLRGQQQDNGLFGGSSSSDFVYDHAIAAYAMCEAYGLSGYQLLRDPAQRGLDYLESHRNPYGVWRYQPRDNDNDTSVTGWCIMAYEAGRHFGLQVNTGALKLAATWLDQVADSSGVHGYSKQGEPSSRKPGDHGTRFPPDRGACMTAVGLFCRYFLHQTPDEQPVMNAAADVIGGKPPVWDVKAGTIDHYYWYYATYALFQMGGRRWTAWQKKLAPAVLANQHRSKDRPNLHGSWDPVDAWGDDGGRVYSTAILALTLQANYRYTRLVR